MQQLFALTGYSSEAVDKVCLIPIEVTVVGYAVELAIQQHSLTAARHILVWEEHLKVALHGAVVNELVAFELSALFHLLLIHLSKLIVLKLRHGLRQNLLVCLKTEIFHKSALFRTEKVAGATHVEVLHREVEAAAKV